jgi:cell division protein FtsL
MTNTSARSGKKNEAINRLNAFMASYFNLLLFMIVALILVGGLLLYVWPKYIQIDKKIAEANKQLDQEQLKLSSYLQKLIETNENYRAINKDSVDKIKKFLPNKPEVEILIEKMEFVAKNNGILLNSLDVDSGQSKTGEPAAIAQSAIGNLPSGVGIVKITMNLSGVSYAGLKNFVKVLEGSLRLLDVTSLAFSPQSETLNLSMETYYLK